MHHGKLLNRVSSDGENQIRLKEKNITNDYESPLYYKVVYDFILFLSETITRVCCLSSGQCCDT